MQPVDRRAAWWAIAATGIACACALLIVRGTPLQTNLLALLPPTERNPVAERAVAALNDAAGDRAVFLVGHADAATAKRAALEFARVLETSKAFRRITAEIPPLDPRRVGGAYVEYRSGLLSDADHRALAGGRASPAAWLARRLGSPLRLNAAGDVAADPFGLFDDFLLNLPYSSGRLALEDRFLVAREGATDGGRLNVLVTAELAGSAFDERVQRQTAIAVADAERAIAATAAGARLLRTGPVFYASAARIAAEREMDLIALASVGGIAALMLAVLRSITPLVLGLATVAIGLAAGYTTTVLAQGELHLLTLVFGASLIGESIDYSIQYFAAHAEAGRDWDPQRALAAVRPGLRLALATSLLGYAALWLMPFPAVNQIALFALSGLAAAYLSVTLLLPALLRRPYRRDISAIAVPAARFVFWWRNRVTRGGALAIALAALVACAPGWLRVQSDDDVRTMSNRPDALLQQEGRIRALTGVATAAELCLVEGETPEAVLRREEALTARLDRLRQENKLGAYQAVSGFVPSSERQARNRTLVRRTLLGDGAQLERLLEQYGFPAGAAAALLRAYSDGDAKALTPEVWLSSPAAAPFRHLWLGRTPTGYASVVLPNGHAGAAALETVAAGLPGVTVVDKAGSVSRLFGKYRSGFSAGLAAAVLVVLALLARRYGWSGGAAVLTPTLLGLGAALAIAGYTGVPVTLFSVMALMLVLAVGVNYAIFLVEGTGREGTTFIAVLLSAATTLLSFGLLSFSGTSALARFGSTLVAGVGTAVLLAPLALSLAPRPARA